MPLSGLSGIDATPEWHRTGGKMPGERAKRPTRLSAALAAAAGLPHRATLREVRAVPFLAALFGHAFGRRARRADAADGLIEANAPDTFAGHGAREWRLGSLHGDLPR